MDVFDKIAALEKTFGKGVAVIGNKILEVPKISSGSLALDVALGGGYGEGRIIELYGPESAGKTLLAVTGAIQAQKKYPEKYVLIIDAEHAIDTEFCKKLGLDTDKTIISQPDCGEQGFSVLEGLIETGKISYAIVDSVAAMTPKAEIDADMDQQQMGLQARMMSKGLRKVTSKVHDTKTVLVFINQLRDKIGVVYGPSETVTGGNALKFYASQRIDIRKAQGKQVDDDGNIGNTEMKCKVVKNKLAPPFRKAELMNIFNVGIDNSYDVLRLGIELGLIKKSGSWFSADDTKLGQGEEKALITLKENPDLFEEIENKIREHHGIK